MVQEVILVKEVFKELDLSSAKGLISSYEDFRLFIDLEKTYSKTNMKELKNGAEYVIRKAEGYLNETYPDLPATLYMEYKRDGNRSRYEAHYFKRREMVFFLLFAELIEGKNRFTDKLLDGVWHILEESTWVLPAHNGAPPHSTVNCPLPYCYADKVDYTDLFAAETSALMAWVYYLSEDMFDNITPVIRERILYEITRRAIKPFFECEQWWTSLKGNLVNNWNPWIVSNLLTACALCVKDQTTREDFVMRAMQMIDGFTRHYPDDGGCDEGPRYWTVAGASYFDCLEIIYDMSGGKIKVFSNPYVKKMMEYIMHVHITDDFYLNFADSPARLSVDPYQITRMGRRLYSPDLIQFGSAMYKGEILKNSFQQTYRTIKAFYDDCSESDKPLPVRDHALPDLGVMTMRNDNLFLGIKGGHNAEGHNHNDVGNFVIFANNAPLFIDAGVGTYTRDTFNSNRYKIWTMRSSYHNLPEIAGTEQKPSGRAKAKDCVFDLQNRTFKAELKEAYDNNIIISYIREAVMTDVVFITDYIILSEESEVTFHLMTLVKPVIEENTFVFPNAICRIYRDFNIEIEEIKIEDNKLKSSWGTDLIYRLNLKAENVKEEAFKFTVIPN